MKARMVFPRGDYTGNLVWCKAELTGKEAELEQSLEQLEQLGYRASAYSEGDGVSFIDSTGAKSEQQIFEEFCEAFLWLAISKSIHGNANSDLAELEIETGDTATVNCVVIVPIEKVHLERSFDLGPYRFVCDQHFDEKPESRPSDWSGAYLQFETPLKYSGLLRLNQRVVDIDLIAEHQLTTVAELHALATKWLSTQPLRACYTEEIIRSGKPVPRR